MAATRETIAVRGLSEMIRDLSRVSKELRKELYAELRSIATPVAAEIREKLKELEASWPTIDGIRPGARATGAVVRQRAGKSTGTRPDWGGTQMREAFLPGLEEKSDDIERAVAEMLDDLTSRNGLGKGGLL